MGSKGRDAVFRLEFIDDVKYWVQTNCKIMLRVIILVEAILRDPFDGIVKPEPLTYLALGAW